MIEIQNVVLKTWHMSMPSESLGGGLPGKCDSYPAPDYEILPFNLNQYARNKRK